MTKTRHLTEIAVCVAMAVVCSFIKVWEMPQGGSVALTMVPILLIAVRRGFAAGAFTGAIYGLLSLAIAGVIYHPMSVFLDYIIAFGILGIAGLFKKSITGIILGTCTAVAGRFICSFLSGILLFASNAPEGQSAWIYSLGYQATYLVPELVLTLAVMVLLWFKAHKLFEVN